MTEQSCIQPVCLSWQLRKNNKLKSKGEIDMMLDKINLANGTSVTWEEFSRWGAIKQYQSILPNRKGVPHTPETREKISQSLKLYYSLCKNNT